MVGQTCPDLTFKVNQCVSRGDWNAALSLLAVENNRCHSAILEQQMVDMRLQAFAKTHWPEPEVNWPPSYGLLPARGKELPEIEPQALTVETLRSGIMGNGAVIVRGLMGRDTARRMCENIDRTVQAQREGAGAQENSGGPAWYARSSLVKGGPAQLYSKPGSPPPPVSASVWAVDSPHTAAQLIDFYKSINLPALLRGYFTEPAVLSVRKWVLRRRAPDNGCQAGWHQDGRFMGESIRTVNLWIALTDCGGDAKAPGLEIVGGGNKTIYETGTQGAALDWVVGQGLVDSLGDSSPVLCPRFQPGDALFFDHYNLHRTGFGAHHTDVRYALEAWFFAASRAPAKQIPLFFSGIN